MPDRPSRPPSDQHLDDRLSWSADDDVIADGSTPPARTGSADFDVTDVRDSDRSGSRRRIVGAGPVVVLLGAAGILASGFFHWLDVTVSRGSFQVTRTTTGTGVPVQFLWDTSTRSHDPTVLAVLIPAAALAVLGVVWRRARLAALVAGLVAMAVGGLYAFQINRTIDDIRSRLGGLVNPGLRDVLGVAPLVCFAGGALVALGSLAILLRGTDRGGELAWRWPGDQPSES
jgi:hypothetical protein